MLGKRIKSILPCLLLSLVAGAFTGALIFLFKASAHLIISLSNAAFALTRSNPLLLPLLIIGAAVLGLVSALTVKLLGNSVGGGIPTSIALLRGLIEFRWLRNIVVVFFSALITFLGGIPLGNEGPSVQMGTAVGRATVRLFAKRHSAYDRYIMTGGASAGFAAATAAPLTAIFFAFEEAHKRFSPMIFMTAAVSSISGFTTVSILDRLAGNETGLFSLLSAPPLPLRFIYAAIIIGIISGFAAALFTQCYRVIGSLIRTRLSTLSIFIKIPLIFVITAIIGFFIGEVAGSGHSLTEELLSESGVFYTAVICLLLRALLLIIANNSGITGGLFLPTIAIGALIGSIMTRFMIALSLLPSDYYTVGVVIGIVAFLAASSRTPIMAMTFSVEALGGLSNLLPIALGITVSYIAIEVIGIPSFTDSVIENKVSAYHEGKKHLLVDTAFKVSDNAFAVGKEIRDILWPPTCVVTSIRKADTTAEHSLISKGDTLHLHYTTTDPADTFKKLEALLGEQSDNVRREAHLVSENHIVPDN